ncbi:MAG: branched-chain amino acid ABC transporter permease [Betaproteobacteria bacterium]|jgi:branched-chain amino acid transport system permease protein|nr:branched-chain amino acid ABC transporter permease [Betaproteobacteria bacterium]
MVAVALAILACLPFLVDGYLLSLAVGIAMYTVLATSWALFSGPTHYISLATAAFYGLGAYVVAAGVDVIPYAVLLGLAGIAGGVVAALVGLATLRLSGVYFVIFTLGLAELVRQIVTWVQNNLTGSRGMYVLTEITERMIFWELLALAAAVYLIGWLVTRSRLGFALRIIGNDEVVAAHVGINSAASKLALFVISGTFAGTVGAVMAPRFTYIEPSIAFSPELSFQVVIMALLGGVHRLWGPLVGVIPFTILWEVIAGRFPTQTVLLLGIAFLLIVYLIPNGVVGRIESAIKLAGRSVKHG